MAKAAEPIAVKVVVGVIASGLIFTWIIEGNAEARARSNAGRNCSVFFDMAWAALYMRAFDLAESSGSPQQRFEALDCVWQSTNMSGGSAAASPLSARLLSMT